MRAFLVIVVLVAVSCNGGGTPVAVDATGTWLVNWTFTPPPGYPPPQQMPVVLEWAVSGGPNTYELLLVGAHPSPAVQDVGPLALTVSGSTFTVSGTADSGVDQQTEFVGSGTISNTTVSGTWRETITDLFAPGADPLVVTGIISGAKQ